MLARQHEDVPAYPYGPSTIYKQSNFGLYGTQKIRYGNIVSEKNEIKTRRYWRPNVHSKRLWSDSLNQFVRIRITMRVLRTLDKVGGLDEYLLGEKSMRIKELGMAGWRLRWRIMQTEKVKERFRRQRVAMGLPEVGEEELVGSDGLRTSEAEVQAEVDAIDSDLADGVEVEMGEMQEGFMQEESGKKGKITI